MIPKRRYVICVKRNPFEYGRELGLSELVDRAEELGVIEATIRTRAKLFLIGPRRYGKPRASGRPRGV